MFLLRKEKGAAFQPTAGPGSQSRSGGSAQRGQAPTSRSAAFAPAAGAAIEVAPGSGLLSITRAFGLPDHKAKELAAVNRGTLRKVGVAGVEAPPGTRLTVPASWPKPSSGHQAYRLVGVGTVYQPNDVLSYFQTLVGPAIAAFPGGIPTLPGIDPLGDLAKAATNLATGIYAGVAPGAAPPDLATAGLFMTTALAFIKKYGIGVGVPAGAASPWDFTKFNPSLQSLQQLLLSMIGQQPGIAGSPPAGITIQNWQAGIAEVAALLKTALSYAAPNVTNLDWLKTAQSILTSYAPGSTIANNPPDSPPAVYDCGVPGWHYDSSLQKCMPDPGGPAIPHIGPNGCGPNFVVDPANAQNCIPAQPAGAPPLSNIGPNPTPGTTNTNKGSAQQGSPWPWVFGIGAAVAAAIAIASKSSSKPAHAR